MNVVCPKCLTEAAVTLGVADGDTLHCRYSEGVGCEWHPEPRTGDDHPEPETTMTTTTKKADLIREADALAREEVHVETNEGTFGDGDIRRGIAAGRINAGGESALRQVYETVGGGRRATGPTEENAPGRMRQIGYTTLTEKRARLAELRKMIRAAR